MRGFLILLLLPFVNSYLFAQWEWQHPKPQGNKLNAVRWLDDHTIVAVGDRLTIVRSSDKGATWHVVHQSRMIDYWIDDFDTIFDLGGGLLYATEEWSIQYIESAQSWTVYKSTDAGLTWNPVTDRDEVIRNLYVRTSTDAGLKKKTGVGLYRTTDAGATWDSVLVETNKNFTLADAHGGSFCVAISKDGYAYSSTDGGAHWRDVYLGAVPSYAARMLTVVDGNTAVLCGGNGFFARTTDQGATWSTSKIPCPNALYTQSWADAEHGVVAGSWSTVFATSDGGVTWEEVDNSALDNILSVALLPDGSGIFVGSWGQIYSTNDFGRQWTRFGPDFRFAMHDVSFFNLNNGIICGAGGKVLVTSNGGELWLPVQTQSENSLFAVSHIDKKNIWMVGVGGAIVNSRDGGFTWDMTVNDEDNMLTDVHFLDYMNGFYCGRSLYKTTDGGLHWEQPIGLTIADYYGLDFHENFGIAVAINGIAITTDKGATWSEQKFDWNYAVDVYSSTDAIIVRSGTLLRTTDAGDTWSEDSIQVSGYSATIKCFDDRHWILSDRSYFYFTDDGGQTWEQNVGYHLTAFSFVDANNGWAVGSTGEILHTTTGGQVSVEMPWAVGVPESVRLNQNYPNPVNGQTAIPFSVSRRGYVTIGIYDIYGRLIRALSEDWYDAGEHLLLWDAASVEPGVYFCVLRNGAVVQSQKIVVR